MNRLPDVADGRNEFIVVRSQRNMYDRALAVAGGRIVEVGIPDRYSGPGVRDAAAWEIAAAITPHTAGIYYLAHPQSLPPLADVAAVAREHGIPLLVDAAAQLPPADNLRRFLEQGADLVAFSGGKAIGGPQASGILCGAATCRFGAAADAGSRSVSGPVARTGGVRAAARNCPACRITASAVPARSARRRSSACSSRSSASPPMTRRRGARNGAACSKTIMAAAGDSGAGSHPGCAGAAPRVVAADADALAAQLAADDPPIQCSLARRHEGVLLFSPVSLTPDDARIIGERLRAI